ncbi:MAG: hypothetical protein LBN34_07780 [Clostridiales Family XIII bacterium]|nr:hypothetical protein [Clostridiales Family XIII bacterium]
MLYSTVLGDVIGEEIGSSLAAPEVSRLVASCTANIKATTGGPLFHSDKASEILRCTAFVSATTALITCGVVAYADGAFEPTAPASTPNQVVASKEVPTAPEPANEAVIAPVVAGNIAFIGGECDCGHLNPKDAFVTGLNAAGGNFSWSIANADTEEVVATGTGDKLAGVFANLISSKADGDYTLNFVYTDEHGQKAIMNRGFHIDTDEASEVVYE